MLQASELIALDRRLLAVADRAVLMGQPRAGELQALVNDAREYLASGGATSAQANALVAAVEARSVVLGFFDAAAGTGGGGVVGPILTTAATATAARPRGTGGATAAPAAGLPAVPAVSSVGVLRQRIAAASPATKVAAGAVLVVGLWFGWQWWRARG